MTVIAETTAQLLTATSLGLQMIQPNGTPKTLLADANHQLKNSSFIEEKE